jgi:transmembrane sensor
MTEIDGLDRGLSDDPIKHEAYEWLIRFMSGEMKPADVDAMKTWFGQSPAHAAAYAEVRRVWQAISPAASAVMQHQGRATLFEGAAVAPPRALSRRGLIAGGLAATAAAAGYLVVRPPFDLWPSFAELTADYRTGIGEQRRITLADAVSLDLNTRTSIIIRSQAEDTNRIELVSGELAAFADAAASPLTVLAAAGRVTATKANFNLRCIGGEVRVSCVKGDLEVERPGITLSLAAGQQVDYRGQGTGAVAAMNPDMVTAWQRGQLIFDATPVAEVIDEVNRYRPGRIVLMNNDIARRSLTAQLRIAEADKIVIQIVHIFRAKATPLPGGIVILA